MKLLGALINDKKTLVEWIVKLFKFMMLDTVEVSSRFEKTSFAVEGVTKD